MNAKKGLITILAVAALGTFVYGSIKVLTHEREWRNAAFLADRKGDNNHLISDKEYASIYNALGLEDTGKYALDLTTKQLRKYVAENKY